MLALYTLVSTWSFAHPCLIRIIPELVELTTLCKLCQRLDLVPNLARIEPLFGLLFHSMREHQCFGIILETFQTQKRNVEMNLKMYGTIVTGRFAFSNYSACCVAPDDFQSSHCNFKLQ